ncbi:hypothetical protein ASF51_12140 [Agreia sp. Leaf283]|nr:hypothetical protein ASF51_12140 [Agreia sp. Leaf283]
MSIVAIAGTFFATYLGVNYQRDQQELADHATLDPSVTYRYDEPGQWTLIWVLRNEGPGSAENLHVSYLGVNTVCSNADVSGNDVSLAEMSTGAACAGGMELVDAQSAGPSERPLVFVRELEEEGRLFDLGAYSAVARQLDPDESVWLELTFKSSPGFDQTMLPLVEQVEAGEDEDKIVQLQERFVAPSVSGINVTVNDSHYSAIRLKG